MFLEISADAFCAKLTLYSKISKSVGEMLPGSTVVWMSLPDGGVRVWTKDCLACV